jgi:hypothetical protein
MNSPLVPNYDGNDYKVAELRQAISDLQDELDGRDPAPNQEFLGLEDFQVTTADPDARFPRDFMQKVVTALHAYDPWAHEIISLSRTCLGGRWIIVRYDREGYSNLSFVMKDEA